jgi:hypothetical protein
MIGPRWGARSRFGEQDGDLVGDARPAVSRVRGRKTIQDFLAPIRR